MSSQTDNESFQIIMLMLEQICYASPLEEGLNTTSVQNQKKEEKKTGSI